MIQVREAQAASAESNISGVSLHPDRLFFLSLEI